MNCHTCGYALWNLRARQCPECGRGFRPSDYRFVPNAVRFLCPHCGQQYFGKDEHGLPSPREFECVGCKRRIELDDMILAPAAGVGEEQTMQGNVPWIDRRNRGRIRAFLQTVKVALIRPHHMMRNLPLNAPTGDILTFGMMATTLAMLAGLLPALWLLAWTSYSWFYDDATVVFFIATYVVGPTIVAAACAPVLATLAHVGLRLTGGCAYGADRTFQAFGAAAGASVACAVPVCGWALGWIWWTASTIAALSAAQRVHPLRAALAVLLIPTLVVGMIGTAVVLSQRQQAQQQSRWQDPVTRIGLGLNQFYWQGGGEPAHGLELALFQTWHVDPDQTGRPFCHPNTRTTAADIPVGDSTLQQVLVMERRDRIAAIQRHIDALPPNLVAHRVGDYIFMYHGGPVNGSDPRFWTLLMLPDPEANGLPRPDAEVVIGLGDFSLRSITIAQLARELEAQNTYRVSVGLPPLPDLVTITHANPAVNSEENEDSPDDVNDE